MSDSTSNSEGRLEVIAKVLTAQNHRVILLNQELEPISKWADFREIPLTESEINEYFHNGSDKPVGIAIALRGLGIRYIAIDIDGSDALDVFWNEFVPTLPNDIQNAIKKAPRTRTKSGGLHILLRIEEGFTGTITQQKDWSGISIECANGNTKHSEINVLGTEFMLREFGPGYHNIIDIVDNQIRFKKSYIDLILQALTEFKKATEMLKIVSGILLPFWKSPDRDKVVFSTSGFLGKNAVPQELTVRLFHQIIRVAALSDDDKEKTLDVIESTYTKIANGETVLGYEGLKAVFKDLTLVNEIQNAFKQLGYFPDYFDDNQVEDYYNENKRAVLQRVSDDTIRKMLVTDTWTIVSENPLKFIIARRKSCYICRGSITYSESGNNQATKKAHLNYGSILIRLFPKQITLHESPLRFLETSERYTIVFENQAKHEVVISGTIEGIISRLKEMPGYVVSSYGIAEALNAIIGAFKDDNKLVIDKTVDFEGYYYHDNDIQISKIVLDKKHPRRTKGEVKDCIDYLEKRSSFQVWKDRQGNEIDRRDLLASLISWTIPGPFNFLLKQLNCRPYLKGFALTGERDGGKTDLSEEMLNMHGNQSNEQNADSIYSVSAGSANTEAKFGKAVSKTTYLIEFAEFGKVESYGRHEDLVECFKTSVNALIVRRGRSENRNDAPFPSLSPLIINGNPPFTSKGELLKRYHVAKFSEEDRHDNNPNSDFNKFQKKNKHKLKILGDWTVRYILDNKQELLLSKKYAPLEIGKKALEAFYKFGDSDVPEWLTRRIPETSLEELDQDIEGIIRSILYNYLHKTLRENSYLMTNTKLIDCNVEMRIEECLNSRVWGGWIKEVGTTDSGEPKYNINSSVLELFTQRLPDLTLKKFSEKTGFKYLQDHNGRMVAQCSKTELGSFFTEGKEDG